MESGAEMKSKKSNRDFVAVLFFVLFAFGLWYFNFLGKETQSDLNAPLKFINLPKEIGRASCRERV